VTVATYYFRPVLPGVCVECGEPYPALLGRVYLTVRGIVHPDCVEPDESDEPEEPERKGVPAGAPERKDLPSAPERKVPRKPTPPSRPRSVRTVRPVRARPQVRELRTVPRPEVERLGHCVCRKCWTIHPPDMPCS
jgi:hypothetical protein